LLKLRSGSGHRGRGVHRETTTLAAEDITLTRIFVFGVRSRRIGIIVTPPDSPRDSDCFT